MKEELTEILPTLFPVDFFSIECDVDYAEVKAPFPKKMDKHFLPETSKLLKEEHFTQLALLWHEEGIWVEVQVLKAFEEAKYPEYKEADSVELFFDTRNIKTAGFATRFCHHFVFLPSAVNGIQCKEVTRFRSEDSHPLSEVLDAEIEMEFHKKAYTMKIFLPKAVFCGYEPSNCSSIGFNYRINRPLKKPQHFSVSSEYYSIEQQPSLWATLHLKK